MQRESDDVPIKSSEIKDSVMRALRPRRVVGEKDLAGMPDGGV